MESKKITAREIWSCYDKDRGYKTKLQLYDRVKKQENFFIGKQWEGVKAPDLPQPVLNIVKRVTNYLISVLVVDDVGISFRDGSGNDSEPIYDALPKEVDKVLEQIKFNAKLRHILREAAVCGDVALYGRFDAGESEELKSDGVEGGIKAEIVYNTNICFGNPYTSEVEKQPYIIIKKLALTKELKEKYPDIADKIRPDGDDSGEIDVESEDDTTTILTYLYKKNGTVRCVVSVKDVILKEEIDTGLKLYPVAYFSWEAVKNCYHGVGVVEEIIPNQIIVNKLWAMATLFEFNNGLPKVFYDKSKITQWDNRVGAVMGVVGNPSESFASSFKPHDMSNQVMQLVESTIAHTKEFMGANDAVLGNVNPTNTSALIQVQKASAAPLELQKLAFYQFIEDFIRIILDLMRNHYGVRYQTDDNGKVMPVDYSQMPQDEEIMVDIGASAYWSETAQTQTLDNLFSAGILTDAEVYLKNVPDKMLKNKNDILQAVREAKEQAQMMQEMAQGGMTDEIM